MKGTDGDDDIADRAAQPNHTVCVAAVGKTTIDRANPTLLLSFGVGSGLDK
jgi:hypothetical protein